MNGIRLLHDQRVPMRDGVRLSADVYLPAGHGPIPALVSRTPYESTYSGYIAWGTWWAQRGYAAVVVDCRGRYESEGVFHAYVNDGPDTVDTLAWVANERWCNGRVGTQGRSYGALHQWLAAPLGSPHLAAMAPHVIMDDYFTDCHYIGGAFQLTLSLAAAICFSTNLALLDAGSASLFNNRAFLSRLPLIDMDEAAIGRRIPFWREWLEHDRYDDFWRGLSTVGRYDAITAPVFQQGGWFDAYPGSALRHHQAMATAGGSAVARSGSRLVIGPWSHGLDTPDQRETRWLGELDFGPDAEVQVAELERRWFDDWLRGEGEGLRDQKPIRLFVMGANRWHDAESWPLPGTESQPWYLRAGGRLDRDPPPAEEPDRVSYDPADPVPTDGGNKTTADWTLGSDEPFVPGPVDQRRIEARDDVLVYTSAPLARPLTVIGPIEVVLYAASSARDTDFVAKLVDVHPDGTALNVTEGILRARYRRDVTRPEPLEPGEPDEFRIELYPTAMVFGAGHRLRVDITSSHFPRFSRNLNTGESVATGTRIEIARQTLLHASSYPSRLILPVQAGL